MREELLAFPVSFAQQRLWFLEQYQPNNPAYHIVTAFRLKGPLETLALTESLREIVRRHELLRTTFRAVEGEPMQVVAPELTVELPLVDLTGLAEASREPEAKRLIAAQAREPFDLELGPLLRATLLRLDGEEHWLALTMHHIISDGWSMGVFFRELGALYHAYSTGRPSPLPPLPIQYADYTIWQREWLQGEELERQLAYWKQQLGTAPHILELPTDHPRPLLQTFQGATSPLVLPRPLTEALLALGRQEGATLFMTLLAGFSALLHRYSRQEEIVVGTPIANRTRTEIEGLIGCFVNTLPLQSNFSSDPTFRELLHQTRQTALGAYAHQDLPFETLVAKLKVERNLSRSPLFQAMFVLQNAPHPEITLSGLTLSPLQVHNNTAKFDLLLELTETPEGLDGCIEYNTDRFEATTIQRFAGHLRKLLESAVADPDRRVSHLALLTEAERQQLLVEWNPPPTVTTDRLGPDDCIHRLFEEQVRQTPEAVAVISEHEQLTYAQLNSRANQVASLLRARGVGPEVLVGICVERTLEMIVGLLGILKAGGAYVPLDPTYPKDRLAAIVEDSRAPVLLTQQAPAKALPPHQAQVIFLDSDREMIARESGENLPTEVGLGNLAYVLYTSGSTGKPKGVAIEHRSAATFVTWAKAAFTPEQLAGVLASTSLCFDLSVFELFGPLCWGGKVILSRDVLQLPELPAADQITLINTVPSAMHELLRMDCVPSSVTTVNLAGEPLTSSLAQRIYEKSSIRQLFNLYGPTEDTTYSTYCLVDRDPSRSVHIGRPILDTEAYLLDQHLRPVPIGVPGELYLGGAGLARGYLHRPELTAEKFISHPFSDQPGARLYKTGDLARYLPDGNLLYMGRLDHQVKIRGFRIELGEIEVVLAQHTRVWESIVVSREDIPGDRRLVAYVVEKRNTDGQEEAPFSAERLPADLRGFLREKLPEYMIPSAFVLMEALPLTPNGKVDRRALPAVDLSRSDQEREYKAPATPLEETLVAIWEEVLGVQPVGLRDNFFDLGGHSLLAVRLFAEIERKCGERLPLATLFQAPTVEQLAHVMGQKDWIAPWSPLVPIQPDGSRPRLFCVHGAGGNVLYFRDLTQNLGPDQPFYGLQYPDMYGKDLSQVEVEELATRYLREIRSVQPQGPYYLGGFSFGGLVAMEIAYQFQSLGEATALLVIFDTPGPGFPRNASTLSRLRYHTRIFLSLGHKTKVSYCFARARGMRQRLRSLTRRLRSLARMITSTPPNPKAASSSYISATSSHSSMRPPLQSRETALPEAGQPTSYVPHMYAGRIMLFRSSERSYYDPTLGWGGVAAGGVDVFEIPGNHDTVLKEPNVRLLASILEEAIARADRTGQPGECHNVERATVARAI